MNVAVFAYGTLQIPEVMAAVTGRLFPSVAATLEGFSRQSLIGRTYPGIRQKHGAAVTGLLYQGLDGAALQRLDDFEDDFYRRQTQEVITCHGAVLPAQVYVVEELHYGLLTEAPWDLEEFRHRSLAPFLQRCRGSTPPSPIYPHSPEL